MARSDSVWTLLLGAGAIVATAVIVKKAFFPSENDRLDQMVQAQLARAARHLEIAAPPAFAT
jgi:hypothetical protein